jgi:hypothetical protein
MKSWADFAKANGGAAWAWMYGSFYRDYFCFFDSYTFFGEMYAKLVEYGYEFVNTQQHSSQRGTDTAFSNLNVYVTSKLAWDSSLNVNTLINNYMTAMYGDAATAMTKLFNQWKSLYASELKSLSWGDENPAAELSKAQVDGLFDILDEAYATIAHYESTNPELYAKLKSHIDIEWLAPAKIACVELKWIYKLSGEYSAISTKFKTLCQEFGITHLNEFTTIDSTLSGL